MNKKIIAFIVSVFCIFSQLSAFAQTSDQDVSDASYTDYLLSVINAINPTYSLPEDAEYFSRIEFVKLLVDVMCPQSGQRCDTGFNDVDSDSPYAASLGFAKDFGIVSEAPLFYPDENVSYTQAIKMAVTAAGYKPLADAKGAYPMGYLSIASSLELTDELSGSGDSPLTIEDGLKLITRLFDALVFVQTGFGDDFEYNTIQGKTFLNYYHRIDTIYNKVYANEYTSLTASSAYLADGHLRIGTTDYKTAGDFSNLLGYNVKAYIKNKDTVIYAEKYETAEVLLNTEDIGRVDGFDLIIYDGIKEKKYTLDDTFNYIRNGKATAITDSDFTPYFKFDTGYVSLIDNNGDNKFDTVKVTSYKYTLVSKVSIYDNTIYDANSAANTIVLEEDCTYSITSFDGGEASPITLKQLSEGMLISYSASDDKKLYDIVVCSDIIDGKITGTDTANNITYINDTQYKTSSYYNTHYSHIGLGAECSFALGIDGKLVAVSAAGENYMKYGWFVGFSNPSGLEDLKLKIFSQTGEMQILTLSGNVLINNISKSATETKSFIEGLDDTQRLVKFSSNANDELKRLDTYVPASDKEFELSGKNPNDSLTKFATGSYTFKSGINVFAANTASSFSFHIESSTYNFIIPPAGNDRSNDSKYAVVQTSYYTNDKSYPSTSVFDVDKSGCAGATLTIEDKRISRSLSDEEGTAVIEKITTGLDPNGESALVVYAWKGNKYNVYYSEPELSYNYINLLNPGDLVRFVTDENNIILDIKRDFNVSTYQIDPDREKVNNITEYISGISYGASDKYLNLLTNHVITNHRPVMPTTYSINNIRNINISNAPVVYVDLVRNTDGTIVSAMPRMSEKTDIRSFLDSGNKASFIVSRQRYQSPALTIVYNIEVK